MIKFENVTKRYANGHEALSQVSFQLKKGEVSVPVRSPFGFHLITCLDMKPGDKKRTKQALARKRQRKKMRRETTD